MPGLIDGTPSNNNYRPGFSAGMMNKDLKLANDCAKSVNAETPLGKMAIFPNGVSAFTLLAQSFASLRSLFIIPAEKPGR